MITTYEQLIQHYGSPLNAAIGLGIIKPETQGKRKSNAIARICNWKTNGLPKRDRKLIKAFNGHKLDASDHGSDIKCPACDYEFQLPRPA